MESFFRKMARNSEVEDPHWFDVYVLQTMSNDSISPA